MKFLVDTNVWLQAILDRPFAGDVVRLLEKVPAGLLTTTDLALHSIAIRVTQRSPDKFRSFLDDLIERQVNTIHLAASDLFSVIEVMKALRLDFDDAFQYRAAERYDLQIVSFDADFDRTPRGRLTPAQALADLARRTSG